jgi:hypothetical protein
MKIEYTWDETQLEIELICIISNQTILTYFFIFPHFPFLKSLAMSLTNLVIQYAVVYETVHSGLYKEALAQEEN